MKYALIRNNEIKHTFPSEILAQEAFADIGCYLEPPEPSDVDEILPLSEAIIRQAAKAGQHQCNHNDAVSQTIKAA